ncbi:DUF4961 domain-containing protein [Phaeocystidibacter marisrubri]|uniref:1,4-alpha-glucan-branching protein n=1 Tax=Phaeocystidibacter marisrubri TaxID=1577780 RepID=A0A6L3ZEG5_9FLAO|nr:alpha-amylase family glycosyl hydrolase [Phaeocystidibacter marisrubri]KAB2815070.1 1,4-alpha-glucan-branching protein [Phaeocystidibacter marisrubri]GGH70137.1 hypothetical protein GCM10011318_11890 [Phaeocystidibacter marisrubri]
MNRLLTSIFALCLGISSLGQVSITPTFATQNDTVIVTFDASQGNGALVGVNTVYAHTGVITNVSTSLADWRHVQGNWGTDDARLKMTSLGNNVHEIKYHINTFYSVPTSETVTHLAFVFRDVTGNTVGRASDGSDIYVPIYAGTFAAAITSPAGGVGTIADASDSVILAGQSSLPADLEFSVDGTPIASATNTTTLSHKLYFNTLSPGLHSIVFTADNGNTIVGDTLEITTRTTTPVAAKPSWGKPGYQWRNDSLYLELTAPGKDYVYVIGSFNDWKLDEPYQMNVTSNDSTFWIALDNLTPGAPVSFQYYVGPDAIRIADPYSTMVLDPWNDQWIPDSTYPNLPDYPTGLTTEPVTYTDPNAAEYNWDNSYTYTRPDREELIIYEMLIRDWSAAHTYAEVINRLDYLDTMGVNAIELMPIMEFEGNESWGYNPSFFFAVDKYYGPSNELKRFVDTCHKRGIAVILDLAINHAFGQNPLVRMYWDGANNRPAANSPWFNPVAKHDFNVGYDFNHESRETEYFTKRVLSYWIEEFRVDGYRMDLSKGFTQKNTLGDVNAWGQYDQSRVDILTNYANTVWALDSTNYMILEHFADNSEESVLSANGMMLWANMNHEYSEGAMAWSSNFYGVTHKSRGWSDMHAVGFMESHDEERMVYRNNNFGNANTAYSTRPLDTALNRVALAATFFFTVPGPKMLWQFGEVGYDYSIDFNGRVGNKPIRWDYIANPKRRALYAHFAELNRLRAQHDIFRKDGNWELSMGGYTKRIGLSNDTMNVIVLGNFNIITSTIDPDFDHTGMWYEYFSNDSLMIEDVDSVLTFQPGEYRIYSDIRLKAAPFVEEPVDTLPEPPTGNRVEVYPTVVSHSDVLFNIGTTKANYLEIYIYDVAGNQVWSYEEYGMDPGGSVVYWNTLTNSGRPVSNGMYIYRINRLGTTESGKIVIAR